MKNLSTLLFLFMHSFSATAGVFSNNDHSVQKAMKNHVHKITENASFMPLIYKGQLLNLKIAASKKYPDGFHSGVKKKGDLYVSCADFIDQNSNKYDIDFLVKKSDGQYIVVQPIVHSVNGEKNPYDLDH